APGPACSVRLLTCASFSFFFSSRRRHTRCYRDWSSDVCSSDLARTQAAPTNAAPARVEPRPPLKTVKVGGRLRRSDRLNPVEHEIGRASCRERVEITVGAGA